MQAAAITSRFLTGCSSKAGFPDADGGVRNHRSFQHIVVGQLIRTAQSHEPFLNLTNELIRIAEQAYLRRDLTALEEVSRILTNLPVDAARQIGLYYHALAIKRKGDLDEAQTLFEAVADNAPPGYRARAIQGLGANYHDKGQFNEALRFQFEALRAACNRNAHAWQTTLMARFEVAIVQSIVGDHKGALAHFERLRPLVCQVAKRQPFYFYQYHNALAVELNEIGRIEEATAACKIALASPFAPAYPEWSETRDEIAAKLTAATPSVVSINRPAEAPRPPRIKSAPLQRLKSERKLNRLRAFLFSRPINDGSRQILLCPIAAAAIAAVLQSILDRMRISPRAPPSHS